MFTDVIDGPPDDSVSGSAGTPCSGGQGGNGANSYRFGFLGKSATYRFEGGEIVPVLQFGESKEWIGRYAYNDSFLYPPAVEYRDDEGVSVPNSARPSHLFRVPASHEIRLDNGRPQGDRRDHANLIMQLVGYLHGTWLQFEDGWFDARVPLRGTHNVVFTRETAQGFISHAYKEWRAWPDPVRKRFSNILFMLNRAPAYEWDWEHFVIEYMVLDACWKTAVDLRLVCGKVGHGKRIVHLCDRFSMMINPALIDEMVRLRNDLFHETLWDQVQVGAVSTKNAFFAPHFLRRFNQRLILGLLDYKNDYMRSGWWSIGCFRFDQP